MTTFFICNISPPNKRFYKWLVCGFAGFFAHLNFSGNFVSLKPEPSYKNKYVVYFLCLPESYVEIFRGN